MPAAWVANEMKDLDLRDKRLNDRMTEVLSQLSERPTASIPAACSGYAETAAAYRFFDNEKVDFERVLAPHIEATRRRMAEQPVVILAQDTTEIDLTRPEQQVAGVGRLDYASRRGLFLHPLHGFTPDGTPLGTVHATTWTRDDEPLPSKAERYRQNKHTPIEDKESHRWLDALRQAGAESQRAPDTQFVCVADSEADIYELLIESQRHDLDWIIRGCQNRILAGGGEKPRENKAQQHLLREQVLSCDVLFKHTIPVRSRRAKISGDDRGRHRSRDSRTAEVEVRATHVTLRPPWRYGQKLPGVTVNVVLVSEINAPADDAPLEWMLLTNLPVADEEQVRTVIEYYSVRWMIEVFFRTLKSGCRVEERRFEHVDRFLPCLAVYLIVTWRTLYVCRLGREFPEMSCEAIFEPAEWQSVYQVVRQKPPPSKPPTLQEMIRLVAQLGGYVNRQRNDEPGPQTVWLGLQRTHDIAMCWLSFGPGAKQEKALV